MKINVSVQSVVEYTPMQIRGLVEKDLKERGLNITKVKFSKSGVLAFVLDPLEEFFRTFKADYKEQTFSGIGGTKIVNLLKSVGVSKVSDLEKYLKEQISLKKGIEAKDVLLGIEGFGEISYDELTGILQMQKLQIDEDGTIVPIS